MLAITALTMLGGTVGSALAASAAHGGSNITINVTCNNNQQITRHAEGGSGATAVNVNVSCGGGGGTGTQGPPGQPGKDGSPGATGATGATGAPGANGRDGTNGTNGSNGKDGVNGTNATVCIVVGNQTCGLDLFALHGQSTAVNHFDTKNSSCTSIGSHPFNCVPKQQPVQLGNNVMPPFFPGR